jgi:hypothetical protein
MELRIIPRKREFMEYIYGESGLHHGNMVLTGRGMGALFLIVVGVILLPSTSPAP